MFETFKELNLEGKQIRLFDGAGAPEIVLHIVKLLPQGVLVKESDGATGFLSYHIIEYFQILDENEFKPLTYTQKNGNLSLIS